MNMHELRAYLGEGVKTLREMNVRKEGTIDEEQ